MFAVTYISLDVPTLYFWYLLLRSPSLFGGHHINLRIQSFCSLLTFVAIIFFYLHLPSGALECTAPFPDGAGCRVRSPAAT